LELINVKVCNLVISPLTGDYYLTYNNNASLEGTSNGGGIMKVAPHTKQYKTVWTTANHRQLNQAVVYRDSIFVAHDQGITQVQLTKTGEPLHPLETRRRLQW
jgi:hypothetical protein